jgi:hypothetical protein
MILTSTLACCRSRIAQTTDPLASSTVKFRDVCLPRAQPNRESPVDAYRTVMVVRVPERIAADLDNLGLVPKNGDNGRKRVVTAATREAEEDVKHLRFQRIDRHRARYATIVPVTGTLSAPLLEQWCPCSTFPSHTK